jgi:hypothetical protein
MAEGSLIGDAKTIGFHRKLTLYSSGGPFIDAYVLSIHRGRAHPGRGGRLAWGASKPG